MVAARCRQPWSSPFVTLPLAAMDTISSFSAFRQEGFPTLYRDLAYNIWLDVTSLRLFSCFFAVFISFVLILPGFRGKQRWFVLFRWLPAIIIGFLLLVCNFLPYWESGSLDIRSTYRSGSGVKLNATLGVYVGLRGMNVTLKGLPPLQNGDLIAYNEHFSWTWLQGKPGFGYDAGQLHRDYRHAQLRGLPYPILWVAETLTIDSFNIRIGRYYRQSGWFAHVFLWLSIPLFVLANVLFQMVIQYGSLFMIFTGLSSLMANLLMTLMRSDVPFSLAFQDLHSEKSQFLTLHYSWCYYVNLVNAILCIIIGLVTIIADLRCPDETANFFGNDVLQSYEDYFADPHEKSCSIGSNGQQQAPITKTDNEVLLRRNHHEVEQGSSQETAIASGLKKRALSNRFSRFQKSTIRKVVPSSQVELRQKGNTTEGQTNVQGETIYENYQQFDTIGEETEL